MIYIYLYMLAIVGSIALAVAFKGGRWFWGSVAFVLTLAPAALAIFIFETTDWSNVKIGP